MFYILTQLFISISISFAQSEIHVSTFNSSGVLPSIVGPNNYSTDQSNVDFFQTDGKIFITASTLMGNTANLSLASNNSNSILRLVHEWMIANIWIVRILPVFLLVGYYLIKWKFEAIKLKKRVNEERNLKGNKFYNFLNEKIEFFINETKKKPVNFGSKINWITIKSNNHESVVREFKKEGKKAFRTNLESGVYGAYASNIFVFPPILNWIIVIYIGFNIEVEDQFNYLKKLSIKYEEVQFFGSNDGVGSSSWVKFINGEIIRAFIALDENIYKNIGEITQIEKEFINREIQTATEDELNWIKGEGKYLCISFEENVLEIAENWSINPNKLNNYKIEGLGTIIEI